MTKSTAIKKRAAGALLILSAAVALPGCAQIFVIGRTEFSCKGGIDGVRCLSARKVYEATEHSDYVKASDADNPDADTDKSSPGDMPPKLTVQETGQVAVPTITQPLPIRTQAKVMRIWTAPWEDQEGDLHADGFIYTEIEGRKWNLGPKFKSPAATLSPLLTAAPASK